MIIFYSIKVKNRCSSLQKTFYLKTYVLLFKSLADKFKLEIN